MQDIVIISAVRTAVGKFGGSLAKVPATDLGAIVIQEALSRAKVPADQVDAMVAAGPARRGYDPATRPVMHLLGELTKRKGLSSVRIEKPGFTLELNGGH